MLAAFSDGEIVDHGFCVHFAPTARHRQPREGVSASAECRSIRPLPIDLRACPPDMHRTFTVAARHLSTHPALLSERVLDAVLELLVGKLPGKEPPVVAQVVHRRLPLHEEDAVLDVAEALFVRQAPVQRLRVEPHVEAPQQLLHSYRPHRRQHAPVRLQHHLPPETVQVPAHLAYEGEVRHVSVGGEVRADGVHLGPREVQPAGPRRRPELRDLHGPAAPAVVVAEGGEEAHEARGAAGGELAAEAVEGVLQQRAHRRRRRLHFRAERPVVHPPVLVRLALVDGGEHVEVGAEAVEAQRAHDACEHLRRAEPGPQLVEVLEEGHHLEAAVS
mmetsp:Transcript_27896/g.56157  ORF Transcript_27896/g.56157 Transcript_27896/m.56157 type:complete len:332 (+) Transcript_27896:1337-2332(+)